MCNNITSRPTLRPTLRPTIFNTFTTLAPTKAPIFIDSNLIAGSILVNGTTAPENVTVCFPISSCMNARVGLIYIPIDYDGIDEPNEYIRVILRIIFVS